MPLFFCRNLNVNPGVWLNVSSGVMIVSFLDSYWWELLSFSQKGLVVHGSRWSALRLMTNDSWFLTWCDSHGGDGRSLSLHLCASPPGHVRARMDKRNGSSILNPGGVSLEKMWPKVIYAGTLVADFRRRTAGTVRKRGKATPYTGQGKWEAGTPNRELQATSKKVKFEEAHDHNKGDARSSSWLDAAPTNTREETRGENMATIGAEASAAAWSPLASPFSPTSSPSECQPSPSAEVTSKEVDSGYSADALCKEHPNWNQVLAEKLCHVRNMDELSAVLEETLAMVQHSLAPMSQSLKEYGPFWARCLPQKGPTSLLPVNLNLVMGTLGDCQYEHQEWARVPELLVKLLGWKWQPLGCSRVRMSGPSGSSSTDWSGRKWHNGVGAWGRVTCWGWTWIVVLSLATLHSTLFVARSQLVKCSGAVVCPLQVL